MHFDLAHAIVAGILMLATLQVLDRTVLTADMPRGKRMLTIFVAIAVVMFIFNLIWPYGA